MIVHFPNFNANLSYVLMSVYTLRGCNRIEIENRREDDSDGKKKKEGEEVGEKEDIYRDTRNRKSRVEHTRAIHNARASLEMRTIDKFDRKGGAKRNKKKLK